jgi:hypothetical protein
MTEYYDELRRKRNLRERERKKNGPEEGKMSKYAGYLQTPFSWDYQF